MDSVFLCNLGLKLRIPLPQPSVRQAKVSTAMPVHCLPSRAVLEGVISGIALASLSLEE